MGIDETIVIKDYDQLVDVVYDRDYVPIALFSSEEYAPICGVLIKSLIMHSKESICYDILILESEISDRNKELILGLGKGKTNISIRFINISTFMDSLNITPFSHLTVHNVTKLFFMSPLFSKYKSIVCLDSDLIVQRDISELFFSFDLNYSMTAVIDIQMKVLVKYGVKAGGDYSDDSAGDYIINRLKMGDADHYYNTGVSVFNLEKCRPLFREMINSVNSTKYWFLEQDIFNLYLGDDTKALDPRWNCMVTADRNAIEKMLGDDVFEDYLRQIEDAYIIHYPGPNKPWATLAVPNSGLFLDYAKLTPWRDYILNNLIKNLTYSAHKNHILTNGLVNRANLLNIDNSKLADYERRVQEIERNKKTSRTNSGLVLTLKKLLFRCIPRDLRPGVQWAYRFVRDPVSMKCRKEMFGRIKSFNKKDSIEYHSMLELKKMKNSYRNQCCFIVGNGPSLTISDINMIGESGIVTFAMNSIYRIFDQTDWRPTFYLFNDLALNYKVISSDQKRYQFLKEALIRNKKSRFLISTSIFDNELIKDNEHNDIVLLPTIQWLYHIIHPIHPYYGDDCSKWIYAYGSTVYLAFQMAVYMGFKEIFLIGTDGEYSTNNYHFYSDEQEESLYRGRERINTESIKSGFIAIDYYSKIKHVSVINATRGGSLKQFPRVSLDYVLRKVNEKQK